MILFATKYSNNHGFVCKLLFIGHKLCLLKEIKGQHERTTDRNIIKVDLPAS